MSAPRAAGSSAASTPASQPDVLVRASFEVDRSLLLWALGLSPRERLRTATRTARMLGRLRRAGPPGTS